MARYRNEFGSVVNVDDDTAGRLGAKWEPLGDEKKAQAKKPARKSAKSDDES